MERISESRGGGYLAKFSLVLLRKGTILKERERIDIRPKDCNPKEDFSPTKELARSR